MKAEAERSGRSQQDVIRAAVDKYLGVPDMADTDQGAKSFLEKALPPETPFRVLTDEERLDLPEGVESSLDLLDREDRF